jgi:hypothetical protein
MSSDVGVVGGCLFVSSHHVDVCGCFCIMLSTMLILNGSILLTAFRVVIGMTWVGVACRSAFAV